MAPLYGPFPPVSDACLVLTLRQRSNWFGKNDHPLCIWMCCYSICIELGAGRGASKTPSRTNLYLSFRSCPTLSPIRPVQFIRPDASPSSSQSALSGSITDRICQSFVISRDRKPCEALRLIGQLSRRYFPKGAARRTSIMRSHPADGF